MADGDSIPADRFIVRYARPSDVPLGILASTAFDRPMKDKDGLSICQLGVFSDDTEADINQLREILRAWMELKPNGKLAKLLVGDIISVGEEVKQSLAIIEDHVPAKDGKPENIAHALIIGLPFKGAPQGDLDGLLASDLLARKVVKLIPTQ
jgi:hypothetical protein